MDSAFRAFFWEFLQNLPLVAGFLSGFWLWQHGAPWLAMACMIAGSAGGSVIIWATEAKIVEGHHEPVRVVLTNIAVMALLMLAVTAYLAAPWSRWWMDLTLGLVGGVALGVVQSLAARAPVDGGHCVAIALALALALLGVRILAATLPLWANVLIVATMVTVAVVLMDYAPFGAGGARETSGP
jgi:hypothetical protein